MHKKFWLCNQTNGDLGKCSRIMFFSAEQDGLQRWTKPMGKGLVMSHRTCVLGSAIKQQHGNAPFPKPLHYVSSLRCGWQWLQRGHPWCSWWCIQEDLIHNWMQREGQAEGRTVLIRVYLTLECSAVQWVDIFITLPLWPPQTRTPPNRNRGTFLSEMGSFN